MRNIRLYQVDAFTQQVFSGNPAAVCPLEAWLPDAVMQHIAMENNLAETAFIVQQGDHYEIRWFTPTVEVDLCGHATLAAAHVLYNHMEYAGESVTFHSHRSGLLKVYKQGHMITLNFPTDQYYAVELTPLLTAGFNITPKEAFKGKTDYMLVFDTEEQIRNLRPDFQAISMLQARGVIVTAKGNSADFVSRFFAPQSGINEDPVTGSAHTTLTPYWSKILGKQELSAIQVSERTGYLICKYLDDRTEISGEAVTYLTGNIFID